MSQLITRLALPSGAQASSAARDGARAMLRSWGYTHPFWLDATCLAVHELVANTRLHGGSATVVGPPAAAAA